MTGLDRLLSPATIAIVGISADRGKHGARVLANLRKLGFEGEIWGVNPGLPSIDGVEVYPVLGDLPSPPDLVICAIPAARVRDVAHAATGAGGLVVFAGGFAETGDGGQAREADLREQARLVGARVLGPNSGGIIRPAVRLAASFLTCLDRPAGQIRSGSVGLVTQSGGTGSYIHNLAAARGSGLAVSVSTGNELDIRMGEAIEAIAGLDEVAVVLALVETVRDGVEFVGAVRRCIERGKPVVACRIGTGTRGKVLMTSHTGAMAVPDRVLQGVLDSLGVVTAETPGEAYEVAEILARAPAPSGPRTAIITHSGGIAIHLADLAERLGVDLPQPGSGLRSELEPLLELGATNNPLDMGGIIGGPGRFAEVVRVFARSGEYDMLLAVSTAHPPAHTEERVRGLIGIGADIPVTHLWMAGDQAAWGLTTLREAGLPVTEEPRAAIRAVAGSAVLAARVGELPGPLRRPFEDWGIPLIETAAAADAAAAVAVADRLGYPVVVKVVAPRLAHKSDVGGVALDLGSAEAVAAAFERVTASAGSAGVEVDGVIVGRYRPGLEIIVGGVIDSIFGPLVSVGLGGVMTELLEDVVFAPAPIGPEVARRMIGRLQGRPLLDGFRGAPPADTDELARIVSLVSRGIAGSGSSEIEINPLVWNDGEWVAVDWLVIP